MPWAPQLATSPLLPPCSSPPTIAQDRSFALAELPGRRSQVQCRREVSQAPLELVPCMAHAVAAYTTGSSASWPLTRLGSAPPSSLAGPRGLSRFRVFAITLAAAPPVYQPKPATKLSTKIATSTTIDCMVRLTSLVSRPAPPRPTAPDTGRWSATPGPRKAASSSNQRSRRP